MCSCKYVELTQLQDNFCWNHEQRNHFRKVNGFIHKRKLKLNADKITKNLFGSKIQTHHIMRMIAATIRENASFRTKNKLVNDIVEAEVTYPLPSPLTSFVLVLISSGAAQRKMFCFYFFVDCVWAFSRSFYCLFTFRKFAYKYELLLNVVVNRTFKITNFWNSKWS